MPDLGLESPRAVDLEHRIDVEVAPMSTNQYRLQGVVNGTDRETLAGFTG